jgi:hypothetical protein
VNFDFGEVFTRTWQITWKYKVLWAVTILPFLLYFLFFPIWLVFGFTRDLSPERMFGFMENQYFLIGFTIFELLFFAAMIFLQILSRASVTLGAFRVETDNQPITFIGLLKDGLGYFSRFLGLGLLLFVAAIVLFLTFFACIAAVMVGTAGVGAILVLPLFLLMYPLMFMGMAIMEQAESAIVADGMSIMESVKQAFELIKTHIWKYVLVTFVIYIGMYLLSAVIAFPLMFLMFPLMMRGTETGAEFNGMFGLQAVSMLVLFPLMTIIQGFALTYLKSAMMVVYLRLTRSPSAAQPVLQEVPA